MSTYPFSFWRRSDFLKELMSLLVEPELLKMLFDKWFCPKFYDVCSELEYPKKQQFCIHLVDTNKIFDDIISWHAQQHDSIQYGLGSNDSDYLLEILALRTSGFQDAVIKLSGETFTYEKDILKELAHFQKEYLLFEIDKTICFINNEGDIICIVDRVELNFGKCYISFQNLFFRW
uniref:Uncharacterized protein n=1 Tax=viral metagenome TaxID=1070528 RepID=A0A6C0BEX1_9ZZZZ